MATAQFAHRGATPNRFIKSDLEMDSLFDFNQGNHPAFSPHPFNPKAGSSKAVAHPQLYSTDEEIQFAGPSHEYDRFPQQTGIVAGDVRDLSNLNQPMPDSFAGYQGFNSGFDESSVDMAWDMDMSVNAPQPFNNKFVDPSYIDGADEPQSNVGRLWPGMHQQAAMQKAQQQHIPHQQHPGKGKARAASAASQPDVDTEESISRLLNRMRQGSALSSIAEDDNASQNGFMSNMAKMKKDEDDMDEDEKLLASEAGKKLSSKERRQLRNKVSARAFRSRRKEYIGQLEGEVATKAQEVSTLKTSNQSLLEENGRYRALIETLLRHPSFTPFLEDLSRDPAFLASQSQRQARDSMTPMGQPQIGKGGPRQMADASLDVSMLSINQPSFAGQQNVAFDFSQPQVFNTQAFVAQQQQQNALDLGMESRQQSRQGTFY